MRILFSIITCALLACCAIHSPQAGPVGFRLQSGFKPSQIPGLQLWLDASDAATLFTDSAGTTPATADGDPVGRWADKSGNANHVTQNTGTKKPSLKVSIQNANNVVRTDGVDDYLASSTGGADSDYTLFFVCRVLPGNATQVIPFSMGEEATGKRRCLWFRDSASYISFNGYLADFYSGDAAYSLTTPNISQLKVKCPATITNGLVQIAKNGNSWSAETVPDLNSPDATGIKTHAATSIYVGCNNATTENFVGDVCEVLYYAALVSDADRSLILSYLNTKWGIY